MTTTKSDQSQMRFFTISLSIRSLLWTLYSPHGLPECIDLVTRANYNLHLMPLNILYLENLNRIPNHLVSSYEQHMQTWWEKSSWWNPIAMIYTFYCMMGIQKIAESFRNKFPEAIASDSLYECREITIIKFTPTSRRELKRFIKNKDTKLGEKFKTAVQQSKHEVITVIVEIPRFFLIWSRLKRLRMIRQRIENIVLA